MSELEVKIPPADSLFDDALPIEASLAEIYLEELRRASNEELPEPIPVFTIPHGASKVYVPQYGMWVRPETFHQAFDFGVSPREAVDMAAAHHERLRELG